MAFVLEVFVEWSMENLLAKVAPETVDTLYWLCWNIGNTDSNYDPQWIVGHIF